MVTFIGYLALQDSLLFKVALYETQLHLSGSPITASESNAYLGDDES